MLEFSLEKVRIEIDFQLMFHTSNSKKIKTITKLKLYVVLFCIQYSKFSIQNVHWIWFNWMNHSDNNANFLSTILFISIFFIEFTKTNVLRFGYSFIHPEFYRIIRLFDHLCEILYAIWPFAVGVVNFNRSKFFALATHMHTHAQSNPNQKGLKILAHLFIHSLTHSMRNANDPHWFISRKSFYVW